MPVIVLPWKTKYAAGTMTNRINGGWMTAVNTPDCRTASTANRQPAT